LLEASVGDQVHDNPRSRVAYFRAWAVVAAWRGETEQAIGHLQKAAGLAQEIGLPGELWQIDRELAKIFRQRRDESQAQSARARARAIVHSLVARIDDERLRKTFLAAEPLRELFANGDYTDRK
jgi:hypothetical protein